MNVWEQLDNSMIWCGIDILFLPCSMGENMVFKQFSIYGNTVLCLRRCTQATTTNLYAQIAQELVFWMSEVGLACVYTVFNPLFCWFWRKERVPRAGKWSEMMPQYERTFHESCLFWQEAVHIWQVSNPGRMTYAVALLPAAQGMFLSISGLHMVRGYELLQYFISSSFWKCTIRVIMQNMKVE